MKCRKIHKKLHLYLEKSLNAKDYQEVQEHLDSCHTCTQLYHLVENTLNSFDNLPREELDAFFYTRLEQKLNISDSKSPFIELIYQPLLKPAMVIALSITLTGFGIFAGNWMGKILVQDEAIVDKTETNIELLAEDLFVVDEPENSLESFFINE